MKARRWAIPYLFTLANLFCGFLAVAYGLREEFVAASWLIIVAGFLDGLDGKIARFTGSSTRFGVEFDSMADLVSFGIAPAVLLYKYQFHLLGFRGWILVFIYVAAGAYRLARFNYQFKGTREDNFKGMPITMAGMTVATSIIFCNDLHGMAWIKDCISGVTVILSALMISTLRYEGLPRFNLETRKDRAKVIVLSLSAVAIAIRPSLLFFPLMVGYLLLGPCEWILAVVWKRITAIVDTHHRRA